MGINYVEPNQAISDLWRTAPVTKLNNKSLSQTSIVRLLLRIVSIYRKQ